MKWCNWCRCCHGAKDQHIERTMWVLAFPNDDKDTPMLFNTKKEAKKMGFGNYSPPIKVRVRPADLQHDCTMPPPGRRVK